MSEQTIQLPLSASEPVLAVGAELKSRLCMLTGNEAHLGEEYGHLSEVAAYRAFMAAVDQIRRQHHLGVVAYDLHPDYAATRYARGLGLRTTGVQHHHAHAVACMAEHGLTGDVIALTIDGTGYGPDETIWGCEVLACNEVDYQRIGRLKPFVLPGGDAGAIETWRPAVGLLANLYGHDWPADVEDVMRRVDTHALKLVRGRLETPNARMPITSSMGRLFDAVAFLLDLCKRNHTEAEAPVTLQQAAETVDHAECLHWGMDDTDDGLMQLDPGPMIRDLIAGVAAGESANVLARAFHETVATMLAAAADRAAHEAQLDCIVLSGGCFANDLLRNRVVDLLRDCGQNVYYHEKVACGDACVPLGQAMIAAARLERGAL